MPGLVYGIETIVGLLIVFPECTQSLLANLAEENSLGVVLGGVLASGGLGYIFATFHHWCHWYSPFDKGILDHTDIITKLIDAKIIHDKLDGTTPRQRQQRALEISLSYWYPRLKRDSRIGNAEKKLSPLGDMAHALGTARIASFFASLSVLLSYFFIGISLNFYPTIPFAIAFVSLLAITVMFDDAYRRVGSIVQGIYDRILSDALKPKGSSTMITQEPKH